MTLDANTPRSLTIAMTNRPPVHVREDDWPVVATIRRRDAEIGPAACRVWQLTVRQHPDGRSIVYGSDQEWPHGPGPIFSGELLDTGADVVAALRRVGVTARCPDGMIGECIAGLPAVDALRGSPPPRV